MNLSPDVRVHLIDVYIPLVMAWFATTDILHQFLEVRHAARSYEKRSGEQTLEFGNACALW